jgi:hypothetical protein
MKIKVRRRVYLTASLQELATEDIRQHIDEKTYNDIKQRDDHPLFVKIDVGKQGVSKGSAIFAGVKRLMNKVWSKTRIREMANWLNRGVPLFVGHGATNSQSGRKRIGQTIRGWYEDMKDGLHAMAIAYIPSTNAEAQEMVRNGVLDVPSVEANFLYSLGKVGQMFVDRIVNLSAVALGSSKWGDAPGFAHAGLVAQCQEMAGVKERVEQALKEGGIDLEDVDIVDDDDVQSVKKTTIRGKRGRRKMEEITLGEMKVQIEDRHVKPTELYSLEAILNERAVSDAMKEEIEERVEQAQSEKQTEIDDLQTKLQQSADDTKTKDDEIADLKSKLEEKEKEMKAKDDEIGDIKKDLEPFKSKVKEEKLSELVAKSTLLQDAPQEQVDYIVAHVSLPDDVDLADKETQKKVDAEVKKQLDDIKRYNIEIKPKSDEEETGDGTGGGAGGGDTSLRQFKPGKNNPLIPQSEREKEKAEKK